MNVIPLGPLWDTGTLETYRNQ